MIFAPAFAKAKAIALPIPLVLPVINTFFPFTSITFLLIVLLLFHQMSAYSQHAELVLFYRFFS